MSPLAAGGLGMIVGLVLGAALGCRLWLWVRKAHADSLYMTSRALRALHEGKS